PTRRVVRAVDALAAGLQPVGALLLGLVVLWGLLRLLRESPLARWSMALAAIGTIGFAMLNSTGSNVDTMLQRVASTLDTVGGSRAPQDAVGSQHTMTLRTATADLQEVFRQAGKLAKVNLILDKSIRGTTPVELDNVDPLQAVELLAKANKLKVRKVEAGGQRDSYVVVPEGVVEDGFDKNTPADDGALEDLAKSYVDKLTRMTPDEKAKLRQSIDQFVDSDAYRDLQRSLGERGVLPVGVRNSIRNAQLLELQGSLYPADGTPRAVTLLVYDSATRVWLDLGLGLLAFLSGLLALNVAVKQARPVPLFLVVCGLGLLGCAVEWHVGPGTLPWLAAGLVLGLAGSVCRTARGFEMGRGMSVNTALPEESERFPREQPDPPSGELTAPRAT
ncbi:MAG: hypothetical protein HY814_02815, partial [Candidatus Riflebacteria bacterium]|nr:hypothetical protein [Candidatus Riflebacteria bacterium]